MTDLFRFLIIFGVQSAAIYAVAASGLVVTYTTSGIFNFAHGAIGMLAAFTYWELWQHRGWPLLLALFVVLFVEAPLMGLLLDKLIMRRLAAASTITTIVVTIGLLVAFVQLAAIIWPQGSTTRVLPEFFSGQSVKLLGTNVSYHSLIVLGCAIGVAVLLRLVLYRTRLGIAMRAVVDNRELSALTGARPDRVSSAAWVLGCMLAALAGVLIAPILPQFTPVALTLLVISAYAAALVGRLRSLPMTFLGALILGELENLLNYVDTKQLGAGLWSGLPNLAKNLQASAPVLLLFLVLIFLRQDRAQLGGTTSRNVIPRPSLRTMAIAVTAYVVIAAVIVQSGWVSLATTNELGKGIALSIVMLSLVLLTGYAGQVSLAQLGFAGIGAVAVWKLGPVVGLVGAVVVAGVVGALVALPALKMRDLYLALTTMAFALLLETNVYGDNAVFDQLKPFAVGNASAKRIPGLEGRSAFFIAMAVAFAGVALLLTVVRNGAFGRRLQAMKDSPAACVTLGLDLTATKLQVFALASSIAGLGGALFAMWKGSSVGRTDFSLLQGALPGLPLVLVAVVGGVTSVAGSVFGGVAFVMMPLVGVWYASVRSFMNLLPGLAGVGLGNNPDGVVSQAAEGIHDARHGGHDGASATAVGAGEGGESGEGGPDQVPVRVNRPEDLGVDHPITPAEVAALDRELGLALLCTNGRGAEHATA